MGNSSFHELLWIRYLGGHVHMFFVDASCKQHHPDGVGPLSN